MSEPIWYSFEGTEQWKEYLQHLVTTNDQALLLSIRRINERQTELEQYNKESIEDNDVGWTKYDAKEMGTIADKIIHGEELTKGEWAKSRNKMKKYWKQLMDISKQRMEQEKKAKEEERQRAAKEHFEQSLETLKRCSEKGIACGYGICSECPLTQGWQLRMEVDY